MKLTDETLREAVRAYGECGSKAGAAKLLGIPVSTLKHRLRAATQSSPLPELAVVHDGDMAVITANTDEPRTTEQLMEAAGLRPEQWEVYRTECGEWSVTVNAGGDPRRIPNWKRTIHCRLRAPLPILSGIDSLLAGLKRKSIGPKLKRRKLKSPFLLEISLYDAHFGKKCWAEQTGQDWDLEIAEHDYVHAVEDIFDCCNVPDVERIIFPLGHDFFNANNWSSTTARGTPVDCVDDRFQQVFESGFRSQVMAIDRCRQVAPTEVIYVPGNHDPETSWYLCRCLQSYYRNDRHVTVDTGPCERKYREYGNTLLGYTHGELRADRLPAIMMAECPEAFSRTLHHVWRTGHWHAKKTTKYVASDSLNGVSVDVLPSLSGTDAWHYQNGFIRNQRAAEVWFWPRTDGPRGFISVPSRSQLADGRSPDSRCLKVIEKDFPKNPDTLKKKAMIVGEAVMRTKDRR